MLLGGLWGGLWGHVAAMLASLGTVLGLWEPLGDIFEALALFCGASGGFQRFPKLFYRFQEVSTVFLQVSIYVTSLQRFS